MQTNPLIDLMSQKLELNLKILIQGENLLPIKILL